MTGVCVCVWITKDPVQFLVWFESRNWLTCRSVTAIKIWLIDWLRSSQEDPMHWIGSKRLFEDNSIEAKAFSGTLQTEYSHKWDKAAEVLCDHQSWWDCAGLVGGLVNNVGQDCQNLASFPAFLHEMFQNSWTWEKWSFFFYRVRDR